MTDKPPTYESLGLVPALHSPQPPPPALAPPAKSPMKIRIFKASQPAPPPLRPTPSASIRRPPRTFHGFLELPGEIRNIIYQFVFTANSTVMGARQLRLRDRSEDEEKYDEKWATDRKHKRNYLAVGILLANHLVYHEALPFLYLTDNTIVITSSKMLQNFTGMPDPLPRCIDHCIKDKSVVTHSSPVVTNSTPLVPVIYNGVFYPKEYDLAFSRYDHNMEFLNDYLPFVAANPMRSPTNGIVFKNLTLDISTRSPSMRHLYEALCFSSIQIQDTFTIRAWEFQRSIRIWIKSSDCTNCLMSLGLKKKPILVEELPVTSDGEPYGEQRRAWKVTWKKGETVKATTPAAAGISKTTTDADAPADDTTPTETDPLPDWAEASGTATGTTSDNLIDIASDDDGNEDEEMTNPDASVADDEEANDEDSSSEDSADLNESSWVAGGAGSSSNYKARGQCKIPYSELKHMDIPGADLELGQIFPGFPVTREVVGTKTWPNGRVLGE